MLKSPHSVEGLEAGSEEVLRGLLQDVPAIRNIEVQHEHSAKDRGFDLLFHFDVEGRPHTLVCEVKSSGQPRYVRDAVHYLNHLALQFDRATPVFMAPYLSAQARGLCRDAGVSYADLEGNCRIVFDTVFIERLVATKPATEKRELKSLFKPKSAQVLRRLLREPSRVWKVVDLAEAADVSLGHVSNVRRALLDRDWAAVEPDGLRLTAPDALLDHWRDNYEPPAGERIQAYTPTHGTSFTEAVRDTMREPGAHVALAANSAAQWLAPYGRTGREHIYADKLGWAALRRHLEVGPIARGANLEIVVLKDDGLFRDIVEPAPGLFTTSPVQTYLDLAASGERGREAADHLRETGLEWPR